MVEGDDNDMEYESNNFLNADCADSDGEEYLGIFLHFMRGENDDILAWPWQGRLTITLLSQRQGEAR